MSKITPSAQARCAAHTLAEQLEQLRAQQGLIKATRTAVNHLSTLATHRNDMQDVDLALEADAWSGHCNRLTLPIEGAD